MRAGRLKGLNGRDAKAKNIRISTETDSKIERYLQDIRACLKHAKQVQAPEEFR